MLNYKEAPSPPRDPAKSFGTITVPGTKVGAIVSLGLVVICWFALPLSHLFILGTGGFGLILGLLLYWKHRR
ncbi:MAG TPA: hypothetical protein VJN42_02855 [Candidatus Acidoferrum sp.]|nr:hypothetical protein [Candidatus Acidoferrum sp.]